MSENTQENILSPSVPVAQALSSGHGSIAGAYPAAVLQVAVLHFAWAAICATFWPSLESIGVVATIGDYVIAFFSQGLLVVILGQHLLGRSSLSLQPIRVFLRKLPALLGLILVLVIIFGGLALLNVNIEIGVFRLMFGVLTAYLAVKFAFSIPVMVSEDMPLAEALSRGAELARGHGWGIFFILFGQGLANLIVVTSLVGNDIVDARIYWIYAAVQSIIQPITIGFIVKLYFQARAQASPSFTLDSLRCELDGISADIDAAKNI